MKQHSTNYRNAFIEVAGDCPAVEGTVPPLRGGEKTAATIQFEMLSKSPYKYTSDDVLFQVYANKNDLTPEERPAAREAFFSKGQPCLRASPLTKRYGWGVHADEEGKVAIYGRESPEYEAFRARADLQHVAAIKSKR